VTRSILSRRALLRGSVCGLGAAVGLPVLDAMLNANGTAFADGSSVPKRFGVFFWGNGIKRDRWIPDGTGPAWSLSPALEPLSNVKSRITVVSGTKCPAIGTVHHAGQAGMMSGEGVSADGGDASIYKHPSVDVLVARAWKGMAAGGFNLLNIAVNPGFPLRGTPGNISFDGAGFNGNETLPEALFDRLFGLSPASSTVEAQANAALRAGARARVLDAVQEDRVALWRRLGSADRARLDQHLEGIVALQNRLSVASVAKSVIVSSCVPGVRPEEGLLGEERMQARSQCMADVLVHALACDLSRVFTFQFSTWYSAAFRELGQVKNQHSLTHEELGDQPQVQASVVFVMKQLAYLLEKLQSVPDGGATLLENSAVLACSEVSDGREHALTEMPIIVAGGAPAGLRTGQHVRVPGASSYRVHVSLFRALGLPLKSFGHGEAESADHLPELLA
jgi:hypothetical protein